jgi:hypothetical protein
LEVLSSFANWASVVCAAFSEAKKVQTPQNDNRTQQNTEDLRKPQETRIPLLSRRNKNGEDASG